MRLKVLVSVLVSVTMGLFQNITGYAQQVEFNYNGRVNVDGRPFDGTGYFKFALVDQSATRIWAWRHWMRRSSTRRRRFICECGSTTVFPASSDFAPTAGS